MTNREQQNDAPPVADNDDHLIDGEIDACAAGKLRGAPLVAALIHLETCDECHRKLPVLDEEKLLYKLLDDE